MDVDDVNQLITSEVDEIEDQDTRQFIQDLLKFERNQLDKGSYHYKDRYKNLIKEYTDVGGD